MSAKSGSPFEDRTITLAPSTDAPSESSTVTPTTGGASTWLMNPSAGSEKNAIRLPEAMAARGARLEDGRGLMPPLTDEELAKLPWR